MSGLVPLFIREMKKWYRDPIFFVVGLLQPIFWIALFGSAIDFTKFIPSGIPGISPSSILDGAPDYITFLIGGVLTTTALFTGMFSGTNIIWDRRLGTLSRFLISPIRRSSIVFSKIFGSIVRIMVQAAILIGVAMLLGSVTQGLVFQHGFTVPDLLVLIASLTMIAFIFSSMFSIIAIRLTKMNSIFGIINLINLPLMFASYAMFPKDMMASWLGNVAQYNPVSWSAQSIRMVIINGSLSASQWGTVGLYLLGLFILTVILVIATIVASETEIRE
ncbi:MAG: ABC transporter permease [Candidatus Thermoplasmatota archaeon]|nr:ABC transporter permease [Candidatus Thermoplasmatota archaeon]